MRNLKRALSLAMASIMILGMMVIGAGAASFNDFSDKDKVVNKEAVSVLNTLGVIAGKDDGSFDPTGIVTRAEMAKMICVVLNGGRNPQLGDLTTNFADTKGHWAEPFIAWCTNLGIVAGTGGGNFEPNAPVTGSQAAKMLLVALGYSADMEKYVGAAWQINVDVQANLCGLYDGLASMNTSEGLSRDNAAQMVYNTLDVKMVEYKNVYVTENGVLTSKPQVSSDDKKTLLEANFKAVKVEGVVLANEYADLSSKKTDTDYASGVIGASLETGKSRVAVTNGEDQDFYTGTQTFNVASGAETLGRAVSIYVRIETSASKAQVIGSAIVNGDNTVVTDYTGDSIADVADDNNLELGSSAKVAKNFASLASLNDSAYKADSTAGIEKVLIDYDSDGKLDYVLLNTVEFGKVTKYSTTDKGSLTVSLAKGSFAADKSANVVGFDEVAKNDYVLASYVGGKLYVAKAESVTGTIDAYKNNSKGDATTKLTVSGTEYNVAGTPSITVAADDVYPAKDLFAKTDKAALDTDATFYLDAQGYIVARGQVVEAAYNYAYVIAHDEGNLDNRVKVVLPDGTTKVYTLNSKSGVKLDDVVDKTVYAYSLTNDGKDIKLTKPNDNTIKGDSAVFEKGKSTIKITNASTAYATNSTVFFYVDDDGDVDTYIGRNNAPSVTETSGTAVYKNNSDTVVAVVFSGVITKSSVGNHLFVYSTGSTSSNYTVANVVLNGKDVTESVKVDAGSDSILKADTLYTYSVNSDGYYELTSVDTDDDFYGEGKVTRAYGSSIVVDDNSEYLMNTATVVVDNHDKSATPSVSFNGNVNKGDEVQVLVSDDKAVMVVITKYGSEEGDSNDNGDTNIDIGGIEGVEMDKNTDASDVKDALKTGNVIINGNYAPEDGVAIVVPKNTILVIKGNFTPDKAVSNSGTIIVTNDAGTAVYTAPDGTAVTGIVKTDKFSITTDETASIEGTVTVSKDVDASGDLTVASGSLTVGGKVAAGANDIIVNKGASVTVKGDVASTGEITVNGTMTAGSVTGDPTINGTLTVKGDLKGDAKVLSTSSLHVTGKIDGDLTVGEGSKAGAATVDGNITGKVTVTAKSTLTVSNLTLATLTDSKKHTLAGTLTVNGTLTMSETITPEDGSKIIFGRSGSLAKVDGEYLEGFKDQSGVIATTYSGKTFTFDETLTAYVSDAKGAPAYTVEICFVGSGDDIADAKTFGAPTDWFGANADKIVAKQPWIIVKVTPGLGIEDELNMSMLTFKKGSTTLTTKIAGESDYESNLGDVALTVGDDGYAMRSLLLVAPYFVDNSEGGLGNHSSKQDNLGIEATADNVATKTAGEYTVTLTIGEGDNAVEYTATASFDGPAAE